MHRADSSRVGDVPTIVLRGDMLSTTGYAHGTRALGEVLAQTYPVLCVSIHEDPTDRAAKPPGRLIGDADLRDLARSRPLVVVNHATPEHFLPVPGAYNVGILAWETPEIPRHMFWPEHMAAMDAMWAPTQFVADFVRGCGFAGPVHLTPYPHGFPTEIAAQSPTEPAIDVDVLSELGQAGEPAPWQSSRIDALLQDGAGVHLAVQSLSPRKGLPVLMSEWRRHVRATPRGSSILLLKLNFRHAHGIAASPKQHFDDLLRRFGFAAGEPVRAALISRSMSGEEMQALTRKASVFVSSSYGEGYGLPIVEALRVGTPVIAPRHTGIADLLPADSPLQFASRRLRVQLRDLIELYPHSSSWSVGEPGALAEAFGRFAGMSPDERTTVMQSAREHAKAFCDTSVVKRRLDDAIAELTAERSAA